MRKRIFFLGWIICSLSLFLGPSDTPGAAYPEKPITFIVTWPAGGSSDQLARVLGNSAEKILGKPIIVENKPGGGTMVGTAYFAQQKPDGYTIGLLSTSYIRNSLMVKVPFDPIKAFTAIMRVGDNINGIVVRSDSPFKTLRDLIDYGKASPEKINYATSGVGAASHIGIEALTQQIGMKWQQYPLQGLRRCSGGHPGRPCDLYGHHLSVGAPGTGGETAAPGCLRRPPVQKFSRCAHPPRVRL